MDNTIVVFRKFKTDGSIIALFPMEQYTYNGIQCMSYMHLGQHGAADYVYCLDITVPAQPDEYKDLKNELEQIGYDLVVYKRKPKK